MGLLKHVVLPLYALIDLALALGGVGHDDMAFVLLVLGRHDGHEEFPITDLQMQLYRAFGGVVAALFANNFAAALVGNSYYRAMSVLLQIMFFAAVGYSHAREGLAIPTLASAMVGVGVVGLAVHSREPGIFTKDKGKSKSG